MLTEEVTLDRLFRPYKPFPIADRKLTIRALSDPEQNGRSMYATNRGRRLEKSLKNPESELYQYRVIVLETMAVEELLIVLQQNRTNDVRRVVEKEHKLEFRPVPDEATDEEKREVYDLREEDERKHQELISGLIKDAVDVYTERYLKDKSQIELFEMARNQLVEALVLEDANMAYCHYTLYCAVMDEDGKPYFSAPEDAARMPTDIIFAMYAVAQEVNGINPLQLSGLLSTASPAVSG